MTLYVIVNKALWGGDLPLHGPTLTSKWQGWDLLPTGRFPLKETVTLCLNIPWP